MVRSESNSECAPDIDGVTKPVDEEREELLSTFGVDRLGKLKTEPVSRLAETGAEDAEKWAPPPPPCDANAALSMLAAEIPAGVSRADAAGLSNANAAAFGVIGVSGGIGRTDEGTGCGGGGNWNADGAPPPPPPGVSGLPVGLATKPQPPPPQPALSSAE